MLPMAATVGLVVGLLLVGALEFVRLQTGDMSRLRDDANARPALASAADMTIMMLRAAERDGAGVAAEGAFALSLGVKGQRVLFDGTPFEVTMLDRKLEVRVQDEAGLAPINGLTVDELARFVMDQGVPREIANQFAAEIADFRDFDSEVQPNGAERDAYLRAGRIDPKNRPFTHVGEVGLLLSAQRFADHIDPSILLSFGYERTGQININASSSLLLQSAFGFTAASAERLIEQRRQRPIEAGQVGSFSHRLTAGLDQRLFPGASTRFRVTVRDIASDAVLSRVVLLEPAPTNEGLFAATGKQSLGAQPTRVRAPVDRETIDLP